MTCFLTVTALATVILGDGCDGQVQAGLVDGVMTIFAYPATELHVCVSRRLKRGIIFDTNGQLVIGCPAKVKGTTNDGEGK